MMKKIFLKGLCALVMLMTSLIFASCGKKAAASGMLESVADSLRGRKVLVVYFSRAGEKYLVGKVDKGNTAFIAQYIAEMTGADISEVKAAKDYESLSYEEMLATVREEHEQGVMPDFVTDLTEADLKQYDIVFVGGPIWWGTYPRVMLTFLRDINLDGKTLIPFTTNEGSGLGKTKAELQKAYPNARVLDGFSITGQEARQPQARDAVKAWLESFSFDAADHSTTADAVTGASRLQKECTPEGEAMTENKTQVVEVTYSDGRKETLEMVVFGSVDMGDGVLWSATNLGANNPWTPGNHYAWGETKPKKNFTESNYTYLKKDIGADISHTWYDAASVLLGGDWQIPTYDHWHTLLRNTTHEFATINGKKGHLLKASGGQLLFLPGNGYIYDETVGTPDEGFYWAANDFDHTNAHVTYLPVNSWGQSNYGRYIGIGIRPIRIK